MEGREGYTVAEVAAVVPGANEEVLKKGKEMVLWFIVTTVKRQAI